MAILPRKLQSRANRHLFSASDDSSMTKQIRATHAPVNGHIDVRPLLSVVEHILNCAASLIPGIAQVSVSIVCISLYIYNRILLFESIFGKSDTTPLKIGVKFKDVRITLDNLCKKTFDSFKMSYLMFSFDVRKTFLEPSIFWHFSS